MKRPFLLLSFILVAMAARAGNGYVYLKDTVKLFYVSNNEIYSIDGKVLKYFQKGNIFFTGESDQRQNIFLMTTSMNPASSKLEAIYEKDNRQAMYTFSDNKFYAGKTVSDDLRGNNELLHIERAKKWMAFYSSTDDSLLAYYMADSLPSSTAIIVAYTIIKKYELEKKAGLLSNKPVFQNNSFASIKPVYGNQTANEWIWDGKVLRPRWNVDQRLIWSYDGQTIKPLYGTNIYEQYSWDGETFKPIWRTNRAEEWTWDGRLMKPVWDTDWAKQYKIEDGVVMPWSNVHSEREWSLDGDIPIPLIILIISGIAKPY